MQFRFDSCFQCLEIWCSLFNLDKIVWLNNEIKSARTISSKTFLFYKLNFLIFGQQDFKHVRNLGLGGTDKKPQYFILQN